MDASNDHIKHVVVLMLENRSFDQMLGDFQRIYPALDGIAPNTPRRTNVCNGEVYEQLPTTVRCNLHDPDHELASVLRQIGAPEAVPGTDCRQPLLKRLAVPAWEIASSWFIYLLQKLQKPRPKIARDFKSTGTYQGHFVAEFVEKFTDATRQQQDEVMGYYEIGSLPALHTLASHFAVCDRWFSSVPGPTWVNRFFMHCGTAQGIARMPESKMDIQGMALHDQRTIYDELTKHGKEWRIYFHDAPQSLAMAGQWKSEHKRRYSKIENFEADVAGDADRFPAFVFIEPQYSGDANDDHPPHDVMRGQELIARIYNGIVANQKLWESTLLIILYDEHGGYYDHVEPPKAVAPDRCTLEYSFDQYGVRVPAVLVSPRVDAGVFPKDKNIIFDHTSIGRFLCDLWGLSPLGNRMQNATGFQSVLNLSRPKREDAPPSISIGTKRSLAMATGQPTITVAENENQVALQMLSEILRDKASGIQRQNFSASGASQRPAPESMRSNVLTFLNDDKST